MEAKTLDEIRRAGLAALERELGPVDTLRFYSNCKKAKVITRKLVIDGWME
jgi:hypothetical protein